jgi:hypothetical protein
MRDTLDIFRTHFFRWVREHNRPSRRVPAGYQVVPEDLYALLRSRIPDECLRRIGSAIQDGWLESEEAVDRTYFIREGGGNRSGQPTVYHQGGGIVIPWWELYVQLADYAELRAVAERRRLVVRMEESQMDIVVWAGNRMLQSVENKETREKAVALVKKMQAYGRTGFEIDAPDKGNDPLRKCKYFFNKDYRPQYFGVTAIGFRKLFEVRYGDEGNRFELLELPADITFPLLNVQAEGEAPPRNVADSLAVELQKRLAQSPDARASQVWMSPGTRGTEFNLYVYEANSEKHALAVGVYKDGKIWSETGKMGESIVRRLNLLLGGLGISMREGQNDSFWRNGGSPYVLAEVDVVPIADAIIQALIPPIDAGT